MIVIVRGPLLSVTGYGNHTRQIWKWARSQKGWDVYASIVPWGMCTYHIDPAAEEGIIGDIMSRSQDPNPSLKTGLSLQVQLPDEWDPNLAEINIGVTAGIEADKCNQSWIAAAEKMTSVVVPSEYSKVAFLNGGLNPQKIMSIPEAITCNFNITPDVDKLNDKLSALSTDFNFLMFGQITSHDVQTDRKNTFNCLKWLCEELKDDASAGIIIKTNMGRMTCQDRTHTEKMISQVLSEIRPGKYPRVHVLHGLLSPDEIGALYKHDSVIVLRAPPRGEGWGLPILDAAASGLPIIATGHSGHLDFLKHTKYLDVTFKLINVPPQMCDGRIWVQGARWAEPNEESFKSRVKKFRKSSELPTKWAKESSEKINNLFNINSVMDEYSRKLGVIVDNS